MNRRWSTGTALVLAALQAACHGTEQGNRKAGSLNTVVDAARIIAADNEPQNWMSHGRTYSEQRFSPLKQINEKTVAKLGLAWYYKLDVDRGTEATPIVVDGVMVVTSAYSIVTALDAVNGTQLWKYDPEVRRDKDRDACCDAVNRGVAVWKGKVYVGALDGRLIALDLETGRKVWEVDTVADKTRSYTISGAPRVIKDKVIIGNGGAEYGVRGYVSAYDSETGKQIWRFFTVPGNPQLPPENAAMELALPTWKGDRWWKFGGGGTVYDAMAYDPELDLLYIGVGNGSPWNRSLRSPGGGDNLFLSSIVALKPDTGAYVWHYQTTPGESWDYTATQHMILADLKLADGMHKVLMQAPKNGFFYVLDRASGQLLSAEKFAPVSWASRIDRTSGRPVENPDADWSRQSRFVTPGPLGAHNWQPMSYSPLTGFVYIPMEEAPGLYVPDPDQRYSGKGTVHMGIKPIGLPEDEDGFKRAEALFKGHLIAWDPVTQREVWRQSYVTAWNGGTLATAGGLVFEGTADGRFVAYAADTGAKLWEARANTGVMAGPVSYERNGIQYISVAAGWGGAFAVGLGGASEPAHVQPDARVLTYKLDGTATLPPPKSGARTFPDPPKVTGTEADINRGRDLYNLNCGRCHGPSAVAGSVLPDLRYMTAATHALFPQILAGAYAAKGMPSLTDTLTSDDVNAIHQYLIKRANDLKAASH